ncbi:hypothetical protein pipiens_011888 [Culex pipiens pipiens]|uniref:Uncharacterized protein n=1 Tax=Culex pipiens pipiens TaxID=38569 RepID=A0ABD1D4K7_CULPP
MSGVTVVAALPHAHAKNRSRDAANGAFSTFYLSCNIFDPRCNEVPTKQMPSDNSDIIRIMYTPFGACRNTINLLYDSVPVPGSPFFLNVKSGCDPSRCRNFRPELDSLD